MEHNTYKTHRVNIVTFLPFSKHLNKSSMITNKVKTNIFVCPVQHFIVHTSVYATVQTYTTYTTITYIHT